MGPDALRLGVDVGGTHTDAVVMDAAGALVAKVKVPTTTGDLSAGMHEAIARLLDQPAVDRQRVHCAVLGGTQAARAIRNAVGLRRVAVLRIGAPLTLAVPPLVAWPAELRDAVHVASAIVAGGCEFDGARVAPLDEAAIAAFAGSVAGRADAIAITALFSPVDPADELRAAEILRRELGELPISMSHEIGAMGLLERENATVLNAALSGEAARAVQTFSVAVARNGLDAECYFTQNDGTLMSLDYTMRFPVRTIGSGPANGMRGGAHSSGVTDAIVADIGGRVTAVGRLVNGFPWESLPPNTVGGVDTNFRLPDILRIPIGGHSIARGAVTRWTAAGPTLDGGALHEALCFGGSTPTLTDAAVAAGRAVIGTTAVPAKWAGRLAHHLAECDRLLADAIDRLRMGADDLPLVVVGGAADIAPAAFPGVHEVIRPPHHDVAGAVGAAIAPVSGQAERICSGRPDQLALAIADMSTEAVGRAIQAGAEPALVQVVEVDEVPLTYLHDPAVRIKVRAAGPPTTFHQFNPATGPYPVSADNARRFPV
jgi:hypothetical protein